MRSTSSSRAAAGWAACSARPTASTTTSAPSSRSTASARCAWATANRTTCRAACTTWPRPPISRAVRARRRFVTVGHSFGGAVALQAGVILGEHCRGVVTLATQSAGCEHADQLGATPLLLLHGTDDEILPPETSSVVQMIAGHGEVVLLPGAGHLLTQAAVEVRERLSEWIPARFVAWARSSGTGKLGDDAARTRRRCRHPTRRRRGPTPRVAVATAR